MKRRNEWVYCKLITALNRTGRKEPKHKGKSRRNKKSKTHGKL
jgi:hypothetical protein